MANFRLLNPPPVPIQGPAGSNAPADSSVVLDMYKGITPWIYPLANGEIVAVPNAIAVAQAAAPTPVPTPSNTMTIRITVSAGDVITVNLVFNGGQSATIDWGDTTAINTYNSTTGPASHTYPDEGSYTLTITGTANAFNGIAKSDFSPVVIVSIGSWLDSLTNLSFACAYQPNIFTVPAYIPPNVTTLHSMFREATAFNQDISSWNTAAVTNMSYMFSQATAFNKDISSWNTAAVSNMSYMFYGATAFDKPLTTSGSSWNTAAVTDMSSMFEDASAFNQNISSWNTAAVTTMTNMFRDAITFNKDISSWNTAAVTDMSYMFREAIAFNQNISSWNTAAVTNMSYMFSRTDAFNQNINSWNTAAVTDMSSMFREAIAFNQNISSWNTAAVTTMSYMFGSATAFDKPLTRSGNSWNTAAVTDMIGMFSGATTFIQNLSMWVLADGLIAQGIFAEGAPIADDVGKWPSFTPSKGGREKSNSIFYTTFSEA